MSGERTQVVHVRSEASDFDASWDITVERHVPDHRPQPAAADVPEDVRAALLAWLDGAR